jgi:malate dehydrogenase (oxaloacetate-decarboxylating)
MTSRTCCPSPSYGITIQVEIENRIGMFARIATAISGVGGDMGAVDIVGVGKGTIIRDITANARDEVQKQRTRGR